MNYIVFNLFFTIFVCAITMTLMNLFKNQIDYNELVKIDEETIKLFISRKAIKVQGFCDEAGVSASYLRRVINKKHPLTITLLEKIYPVMVEYGYQYFKLQNIK